MTTQHDSRERWRRLSSLFDEASKLPPGERAAFLDAACAGDRDLEERVKALLEAGGQSGDFAGEDTTLTASSSGQSAGEIGPYRLLEKIGEGGMGEVWLAEQSEPIRRRVALKLIKAGMDTRQVIARFEAERQALALMDHPAIARVYEAGETPRGGPFFAMEYIQGEPITLYADRHRLTTAERLTLFSRVCEAVQHAHQKGIIHRDLKPPNVLVAIVGDVPMPKIIDFGIAKATAQRLTEKTMFTEMGVLVGTPEYMSPEQAEMTGLDVDTRTDVYALGVILYELLAGALPFEPRELRQAGYDEIRRRIREVDPPRPSTRVRTLGERSTQAARNRRTDPGRLVSRLRGDLDWIVMKALEKDRTRRYGSPSDLAADLARHLKHEPVLAGPPGAGYRAGKFVRRHRFGVAAAALALAGLAAFAVTMGWQARAIARERDRAERVSGFLVDLFRVSDPGEARGRDVTAREILDRGAGRIEKELNEDPLIQARLMKTMGSVYRGLGLWKEAEQLHRKAIGLFEQHLGPEARDTLDARHGLATTLEKLGRYKEAEAIDAALVASWTRLAGKEHPDTLAALHSLGVAYEKQGRFEEAERIDRTVLAARRRILGDQNPSTLWSENNLGAILEARGRLEDAEVSFRRAYDGMKRVRGADHPDTLWFGHNLATLLYKRERSADAEALFHEIIERRKAVLGPEHPSTLASMNNLTILMWKQGRFEQAEQNYRYLLEASRRVRGDDHPATFAALVGLATVLRSQKRYDEAEPLVREAYEGYVRVLGPSHPHTQTACSHLVGLAMARGRSKEALGWLRKAVDAGYADADELEGDADLAPLRSDPAFQRLVADARANHARAERDGPPGVGPFASSPSGVGDPPR